MLGRFTKWISDAVTAWLTYDHPYEGIPLCDFERIRYELRPCDVLLIEGRSRVSEIIRTITQSSWSHAALYIGRLHDIQDPKVRNLISAHFKGPPDTQLLIEGIMGKGGLISDIMSYQKDHIRLCRPRGLSRQDAQQVISYAVRKLGHDYDIRHVVDLARFLLPWTLFPRRFRSKLFEYHPGDSTRTVCSTLIAEAFNHVEFPILPLIKQHATTGIELITRNPKLYTPRDFDYSPYFEIIKYPFVEFADYAMYRKLPWNREGLVSHDRVGVRDALAQEREKRKKEEKEQKKLAGKEQALLSETNEITRNKSLDGDNLEEKLSGNLTEKEHSPFDILRNNALARKLFNYTEVKDLVKKKIITDTKTAEQTQIDGTEIDEAQTKLNEAQSVIDQEVLNKASKTNKKLDIIYTPEASTESNKLQNENLKNVNSKNTLEEKNAKQGLKEAPKTPTRPSTPES